MHYVNFAEDYGGHGNSFYGSGGRGNKRAQMRYCLRLLRSMCSVGDDLVNQDMVDQGAIDQLVGKQSFPCMVSLQHITPNQPQCCQRVLTTAPLHVVVM